MDGSTSLAEQSLSSKDSKWRVVYLGVARDTKLHPRFRMDAIIHVIKDHYVGKHPEKVDDHKELCEVYCEIWGRLSVLERDKAFDGYRTSDNKEIDLFQLRAYAQKLLRMDPSKTIDEDAKLDYDKMWKDYEAVKINSLQMWQDVAYLPIAKDKTQPMWFRMDALMRILQGHFVRGTNESDVIACGDLFTAIWDNLSVVEQKSFSNDPLANHAIEGLLRRYRSFRESTIAKAPPTKKMDDSVKNPTQKEIRLEIARDGSRPFSTRMAALLHVFKYYHIEDLSDYHKLYYEIFWRLTDSERDTFMKDKHDAHAIEVFYEADAKSVFGQLEKEIEMAPVRQSNYKAVFRRFSRGLSAGACVDIGKYSPKMLFRYTNKELEKEWRALPYHTPVQLEIDEEGVTTGMDSAIWIRKKWIIVQ